MIGVIVYVYKPHKEIEPSYVGSSKEFIQRNELNYNAWYTKSIELEGVISAVLEKGFMLDGFIYCQLKSTNKELKINQIITVKGIVVGYDELLNELKLNQCILK